ncbi:hypothetical protein V6N12_058158 [Hibiscus sabdariffa]|uniref:Uncharacterized protein n=1 Tax=Hibiscus sabdariffa TaxID=183260 RepID=A0ABR1ZIU9_9ROSI
MVEEVMLEPSSFERGWVLIETSVIDRIEEHLELSMNGHSNPDLGHMRCPLGGSEPRNRNGRSRCFVRCPCTAQTATGSGSDDERRKISGHFHGHRGLFRKTGLRKQEKGEAKLHCGSRRSSECLPEQRPAVGMSGD